jgi:hypothetical protein
MINIGKVVGEVAQSIESFFKNAFKARITFWKNSELDKLNFVILTLIGYILISIARDNVNKSSEIQNIVHSIIVCVIFVMFACGMALMVDSKIRPQIGYLRNANDLIFVWIILGCFFIWLDRFPVAGWIVGIDRLQLVGRQWELAVSVTTCLIAAPFILFNTRAMEGNWQFMREPRVVCWAGFELVIASIAVWEIVFEIV